MLRRQSADVGVVPDMNVTPLVDVVLVLLIIFMVVAPHLEQDVPVNLPGIFNPDPTTEMAADPLKVTVARAGEFRIDGKDFGLEPAIDYLREAHAAAPERRLVLRGDTKLKNGAVRELMGRSQEIGFPGLNLMVGEKHRDRNTEPLPASAPERPPAAEAP